MPPTTFPITRRHALAGTAAAGAIALMPAAISAATSGSAIRPFRVDISDAARADARRDWRPARQRG